VKTQWAVYSFMSLITVSLILTYRRKKLFIQITSTNVSQNNLEILKNIAAPNFLEVVHFALKGIILL
jgi:hypothetical protein